MAIPPLLAPQAGTVTLIDGRPGRWQIVAQSPDLRLWWAMPWNDEARTDPELYQGHARVHVIDIIHPSFMPGVQMVTLRITGNGRVRDRQFQNLEEAAKFGVAYYLTDNGYASRSKASTAARKVRQGDEVVTVATDDYGAFTFQQL